MTHSAPPVERRVDWPELFFDLVFVVVVTRTSELVAHHPGGLDLLRALVAFVPVYWVWVGAAIQANQRDTSSPALRLELFVVALAGVFMAVAMTNVYGDRGLLFALAYWVARAVHGLPSLVRSRALLTPYALSTLVTGPLLVVGALLDADARLPVWAVAALMDLSAPLVLSGPMSRMLRIDAGHLAERFGLLVLIALGESMVAVASAPEDGLDTATGFTIAIAFVAVAALCWVYFQFANPAMRYGVSAAAVPFRVARLVLTYAHLILVCAVVVVAVGLHGVIAAPHEHISWTELALLDGGAAVFLGTFVVTRWAMFHRISATRLPGAAICVLLIPLCHTLPSLVALAALAFVLVAVNVVEWRWWDRVGWERLVPPDAPLIEVIED